MSFVVYCRNGSAGRYDRIVALVPGQVVLMDLELRPVTRLARVVVEGAITDTQWIFPDQMSAYLASALAATTFKQIEVAVFPYIEGRDHA